MRLIDGRLLFRIVAAALIFALLAGWAVQRDSPQGIAVGGGAAGPCAPLTHALGFTVMVMLGVAAALALAVAAGLRIVADLELFRHVRPRLLGLAATVAMAALVLAALMTLRIPLEAAFPRAPRPGCATVAPVTSVMGQNPG